MYLALRFKAIVVKEFRQISRDVGTITVLVALPIFLLVLFGYAISLDVRDIKLAVWNQDRSPRSREFLENFFNSGYFSYAGDIRAVGNRDEYLQEGKALMVLTIPSGFERDLDRGSPAEVQVLVDGSNSTTASTALGYLQGAVSSFSRKARASRFGGLGTAPAIDLRTRVVYNQELKSINALVPGLIVLILTLASVISTALALVKEKEHGTMEQLEVSPINAFELVVGKTLPYLLIAIVSACLVLASSRFFFGVEIKGSLALLFSTMLLFLLCSLGIGILISSVVDTQQAAFMIGAMVTILPSFILSGFIFPIRNMPKIIQYITVVFPARHYLTILRAIMMKGVSLSDILPEVVFLASLSVVFLGGGALRLSKSRS